MNLLIIRPGAIGDALLTFPVLKALRAHYPNPHITFVSNANVLPLALACGLAEQVSDYGHAQWSELFSTTGIQTPAMREQLQRIDLAICWLRDSDGLVAHNLRRAGVRQVVVAAGRPAEGMHIHVVEYLAQTIGMHIHVDRHFMLPVPADAQRLHQKHIAIHPGSGGAQKCWPTRHFAAVIEQLWQPYGLRGHSHSVLLLAGPADQERIHDILNYIGQPPKSDMLKVLVHEPLLEVAQQLQQCTCYLGNDSGITHLAAMLGVPTVALFGPSNPAIWHPVGPSVRVIREQVLEHLAGDVVIDALESFLFV